MERREFLKTVAAAGVTAAMPLAAEASVSNGAPTKRPESPSMIYRELGTTGERVSAIGMGGAHIGFQPDPQESIRLVHAGIDAGITFMDNCWDYNGGHSEERMGQALAMDGYRQKVFLMTKMDGRTADAYTQQLEQSLKRLQTDMIDLVQFHEVIRMEDPDRIFAPGGALEGALKAREAGKIRYIGFTGHKDPLVHLRMLEVAKQHNFHFDTVQMPVNVLDASFRSFIKHVIPVAQQEGIGVLGMKSLGSKFVLRSGAVKAPEALRFSLSQPVSVLITGIDSQPVLEQALDVARNFKPMSQQEQASLIARTARVAQTGKFEPFKTSNRFDGTAKNPQWLG